MEKNQNDFKAPFPWHEGITLGDAFNRIGEALYGEGWKEETICIFNEGNPICSEKEYITEDQLAKKIQEIGNRVERMYTLWQEGEVNPDNRNIEQDYNYHYHLFVYGDNEKLEFPLGTSNIGLRDSEAWDDLFNFDTGSYQLVSDEGFQQFLEVRKTLLQALEKQELKNYCQNSSMLEPSIPHNAFKHFNGWFVKNDTRPPEYKKVDTAIYTFNITDSCVYEGYPHNIRNTWEVRISPDSLDNFIGKLLTGGSKRRGRPPVHDWDTICTTGLEIIGEDNNPNYCGVARCTYEQLKDKFRNHKDYCTLPDYTEIARELSTRHKKQLLVQKKI